MVNRVGKFATCVFLIFLSCFFFAFEMTEDDDPSPYSYTVKQGDTLTKIASKYGNIVWWIDIYEANRNKIEDPNLIYPGQRFAIPDVLAQYSIPLNMDQVRKMVAMSKSVKHEEKEKKHRRLKKFRKAFSKLIKAKKRKEQRARKEEPDFEGLGLGGLILDETRSKMGSNFYSVFYKLWEGPKDVRNFTITVSEQPIPSRGTMVQVKIDNQLVFKNRLEPRYYKTEQAAKRAVKICQRRVQRIATMENELAGY